MQGFGALGFLVSKIFGFSVLGVGRLKFKGFKGFVGLWLLAFRAFRGLRVYGFKVWGFQGV